MKKKFAIRICLFLLAFTALTGVSFNACAETADLDFDAYNAARNACECLDAADYTEDSYGAVAEVYEIYNPNSWLPETQEDIDIATSDILRAVYDLKALLHITVSSNIEGASVSIACDGTAGTNGTYTVPYETQITVQAPEMEGYLFGGWLETRSGRMMSDQLVYSFPATVPVSLQAYYINAAHSGIVFCSESGQIMSVVTKTPQEWAALDSMDALIPRVPYRFGYTNGRWDLPSNALTLLQNGEFLTVTPLYDPIEGFSYTPYSVSGAAIPVLKMQYRYDAENLVGSFIMNTCVPQNVTPQSVGMLFCYNKASLFNPDDFFVNINNKMTVSLFDSVFDEEYITDVCNFTSRNNWAVRGYMTYYDNGVLRTVYSNQVNVKRTAATHIFVTDAAVASTCTETGLTQGEHCIECGLVLQEQQVIPALGHDYTETVIPPTCTENGSILHSCSRCGDTYSEAPVYDEQTQTYTHPELLATGHQYVRGAQISDATFEQDGAYEATCSVCGDTATFPDPIVHGTLSEDILYEFDRSTGVLTVSGSGAMPDYTTENDSPFCRMEAIQKIVITEGVTAVGRNSFYGCPNLTEVVLGDGVTAVGATAFYNCNALAALNLPSSLTEIGYYAFYHCDGIETLTFPASTETLGNYAFAACLHLQTVSLPDGIGTVGNHVFDGCTALTAANVPVTGTSFGNSVYQNCTALQTVTVSSGVTHIEPMTFSGCSSLTSVSLPDSIVGIKTKAFFGCTSLQLTALPTGLVSVESYAFYKCTALGNLTLPASLYYIGESAFSGCSSLITEIPSNVHELEKNAFRDCTSLTAAVLPSWLTKVSDSLFAGCTSLTSVTLHDNLTEIGISAFKNCVSLTAVQIPDTVTEIKNFAFKGCTSLQSIFIGEHVTQLGSEVFADCTGITAVSVSADNTVFDSRESCNAIISTASNTLLFGCRNTVIPVTVTAIDDYAFEGCTGLTAMTVPDSVVSIGKSAFAGCSALGSMTLPAGLTVIRDSTFLNCSSLAGILIPDGVCTLETMAFKGCSALTAISLPEGAEKIEASLFADCTSLQSVHLPDTATAIGVKAFENCGALTAVNIPLSISSINSRAFANCSSLTDIVIPDGLKVIGSYAFLNCGALTSVSLPVSVITVGASAFKSCSGMTDIYIYNVNCSISDNASTLPEGAAIHSYLSSTANDYASRYNRQFIRLS